jgi:ADP-heptose:LPS heptosyltransferase
VEVSTQYTNLVREVSAYRFDLAIFSYAEKRSAALIRDAGIPYRLGPLRRSFFSKFNLWYYIPRQKTGQAEYQLNLKILRSLGLKAQFHFPRVEMPQLTQKNPRGKYIVMHPFKRSGTALVWPMENFLSLARNLTAAGTKVIVIGDREDSEILHSYFGSIPLVEISTELNLVQTAALIAGAHHFFGNSSGPLHLAALVGTAHTGFYPQNKIAAPRRWRTLPLNNAPRLSEHLLSTDFPVNCVRCRLERCEYYPCTAAISVESAADSPTYWKKPQAAALPLRKKPPKRRTVKKRRVKPRKKS